MAVRTRFPDVLLAPIISPAFLAGIIYEIVLDAFMVGRLRGARIIQAVERRAFEPRKNTASTSPAATPETQEE